LKYAGHKEWEITKKGNYIPYLIFHENILFPIISQKGETHLLNDSLPRMSQNCHGLMTLLALRSHSGMGVPEMPDLPKVFI